ncbi:MAG: hypothetical protein SFV55_15340 [Haliscomenobacter sp.]|uniref:hypothetical protein n=1 Tax=Haliscomenobacter sp. TaxID=2717303 RepID=UPI0029BCDE7E|nr:hypothetical protein [Haliscomenobacter sp.]MDX2069801.1 hypothetical protein [Haliscomenobacter sp.]
MKITIEVFNQNALNILLALERLKLISLVQKENQKIDLSPPQVKEFKAISLDTKGIKFRRKDQDA